MGKGFLASEELKGQDLAKTLEAACSRAGLDVKLSALVNDSAATLLSRAYTHPSTRFGLILGTGVNIAAYLPVRLVGSRKFGNRPEAWYDEAHNVIVNAELSMFGHDILPLTRWDTQLKEEHPMPEYQPLEQVVSGMYLGEITRLVLVEAVHRLGVLGGKLPESLLEPYTMSAKTLAVIEWYKPHLPLLPTPRLSEISNRNNYTAIQAQTWSTQSVTLPSIILLRTGLPEQTSHS